MYQDRCLLYNITCEHLQYVLFLVIHFSLDILRASHVHPPRLALIPLRIQRLALRPHQLAAVLAALANLRSVKVRSKRHEGENRRNTAHHHERPAHSHAVEHGVCGERNATSDHVPQERLARHRGRGERPVALGHAVVSGKIRVQLETGHSLSKRSDVDDHDATDHDDLADRTSYPVDVGPRGEPSDQAADSEDRAGHHRPVQACFDALGRCVSAVHALLEIPANVAKDGPDAAVSGYRNGLPSGKVGESYLLQVKVVQRPHHVRQSRDLDVHDTPLGLAHTGSHARQEQPRERRT